MSDNRKNKLVQQNPFLDLEATVDRNEEEHEEGPNESDDDFLDDETVQEEDVFNHHLVVKTRMPVEDNSIWEALPARARSRGGFKEINHALLTTDTPACAVEQTWVRIRATSGLLKGYRGEVALATPTNDAKRINYTLVPVVDGRRELLPERSGERPRRGAQYCKDGFLRLTGSAKMAVSWAGQVLPTADEYHVFRDARDLTKQLRRDTETRLQQNVLEVGHRVKFVVGPFEGLTGTIAAIQEYTLEVWVASLEVAAEVLPYEVRKEIRLGDKLLVTAGEFQRFTGWAIAVGDNTVSIFVRQKAGDATSNFDREIDVNLMDVVFNEEYQAFSLRDLSLNKSDLTYWSLAEEKKAMRENPNKIFIGKTVMVIGANEYKGVTGTIKDTSLDGHALVALDIFNHARAERFRFDSLRLVYTNTTDAKRTTTLQPLMWHQHASTSVIHHPVEKQATPPQTPMPIDSGSEPAFSAQSPAWDPTHVLPGTLPNMPVPRIHSVQLHLDERPVNPPFWLGHPKFQHLRVRLYQRSSRDTILEFRRFNGETVAVRERSAVRQVAVKDVAPVIVRRKEEVVVCFGEGEFFGELFRIKTYGHEHCVVRKYGTRGGKGEKLWTLETQTLAEVFPGFQS